MNEVANAKSQSTLWWRNALSINEANSLLEKHDPLFNKIESHKIASPYNKRLYPSYELIEKIYLAEGSPIASA
jgi:hypothetical protein